MTDPVKDVVPGSVLDDRDYDQIPFQVALYAGSGNQALTATAPANYGVRIDDWQISNATGVSGTTVNVAAVAASGLATGNFPTPVNQGQLIVPANGFLQQTTDRNKFTARAGYALDANIPTGGGGPVVFSGRYRFTKGSG